VIGIEGDKEILYVGPYCIVACHCEGETAMGARQATGTLDDLMSNGLQFPEDPQGGAFRTGAPFDRLTDHLQFAGDVVGENRGRGDATRAVRAPLVV
jgi:hypothetical protein